MLEYHGWLVIRAHANGDSVPADDERAINRVRGLLAQLPPNAAGLVDLRGINGKLQLHVADTPKRSGPRVERVLDIIRETARDAPGSYGLVYLFDNERSAYDNEFRVLVIRNGEVTEHPDPFLSPFDTAIEDQ